MSEIVQNMDGLIPGLNPESVSEGSIVGSVCDVLVDERIVKLTGTNGIQVLWVGAPWDRTVIEVSGKKFVSPIFSLVVSGLDCLDEARRLLKIAFQAYWSAPSEYGNC